MEDDLLIIYEAPELVEMEVFSLVLGGPSVDNELNEDAEDDSEKNDESNFL